VFIEFYRNNKKYINVAAVVISVLLLGLLYFRFFVFQVLSIDPPTGSTISSSSRLVTFSYNKNLDSIDREKQIIASDDRIISSVRTDGAMVLLQLKDLEIDKVYKITLLNIRAEDGSEIKSTEYTFDYKYVPYNKLSKKEQQRQITQTDKGNISSPVIKALPVTTSQFYISYKLLAQPDSKGKQEKIIIALLLTNQELTDKAKVIAYKKAAIEYLLSKGVDVKDYSVEYAPEEAAQY